MFALYIFLIFSKNIFLIYSVFYNLAVINILILVVNDIKIEDCLILFNVIILAYSLVMPTVLTKDPILGGDLSRELFISHGLEELHSIELLGVHDQIAFTSHVILCAIFQSIVPLNILQINSLLFLVFIFSITVLSYKLTLYTSSNRMLASLSPLVIVLQQIFLYSYQQGLRSFGWIVLFATLMLIIVRFNFQYRALLLILLTSCAMYYYTFSLLGIFLFPILILIFYKRNKETKAIIAMGLIYSIVSIAWNFTYNYVLYYTIPSAIKGMISSLSEILSISKLEVNYAEMAESTYSWKITLLINVIYVLIIEAGAFLAFLSLVRHRKELKMHVAFIAACSLWGGGIVALTVLNIGLRLSLGINRALGLSIIPALLYFNMSLSKISRNHKNYNRIKLYGATKLFLLILILVTYVVNTGTLHALLNEDGFTYLDRESRRYLLWSVPLVDSIGYDFIAKHYQRGDVLADSYADNVYYLLFSLSPLNQSFLHTFHSISNNYIRFVRGFDPNNVKDSLVIMRYSNIKTGQIFLGGIGSGYSEKLNMDKLNKTMSNVYNNGDFFVLKN